MSTYLNEMQMVMTPVTRSLTRRFSLHKVQSFTKMTDVAHMSLNVVHASCLQDGATVGEVPVLLRATFLELFACEALRGTHLEFHISKCSALHCALNRNRNTLVTCHHHPVATRLSITQSQPGSQLPSHNRALNCPVVTGLSITQ